MSKAENYIRDYTKNCSNEAYWNYETSLSETHLYQLWLTPENALRAVEIERQELIEKAAEWIKNNRDDDFFELVEEYNYCGAGHLNINRMVEEFKKYMED